MEPRIETMTPKALIGICRNMSLARDETPVLWRAFMPRRNEIQNRRTSDFLSMQVYSEHSEPLFSPDRIFTKWAAVEVSDHDMIPDGMELYFLGGGLYAVFVHRGPASSAPKIMHYIFGEWLPNSDYQLDSREHFEVLGEGYSPTDPEACEEIWIPIKFPEGQAQ